RLWNLTDPQEEPRILPHEAVVLSVAFSEDGKTLLTGSADGTARVWDRSGQPLHQPLRHGNQIRTAKFSSNGKSVLVGVIGKNGSRLWNLSAGSRPEAEETPEPGFIPLALSRDRETVLTLEGHNVARLRDAVTGQVLGEPLEHPRPV